MQHRNKVKDADFERNSMDLFWMRQAYDLASHAEQHHEVPVGAVLVKGNQIVGRGWNQPISSCDPTAHAEIIALREAAKNLSNYRLLDTTLYVTLEPCAMCVGALMHARIDRLVFATHEPRAGAVCSAVSLMEQTFFNHRVRYESGLMAQECGNLLKNFFKNRRS